MSVKLSFARLNHSVQSNVVDFVSSSERIKIFVYVQVLTTGWERGARNRSRNFDTVNAALTYVDKLFDNGFMLSNDYNVARMVLLRIKPVERHFRESDDAEFLAGLVEVRPSSFKPVAPGEGPTRDYFCRNLRS